MPRLKSDEQRGYIGAWMRRERKARHWTEYRAVEELAKRGVTMRPDYWRQLEARTAGRTPGPDLMEDLVGLFGTRPEPPVEPEVKEEPPGEIAAAIRELVAEVQQSRQEQRQSVAFLTDLLGLVARIAGGEAALEQIADAVRARTPASPE
ncbi:MAG: hypothetical protein EPN91_12125 [Salinibacterium sp.]|nr:MAG: hypothetical protein EPN91_12125 [Salinibacterium sp.]